MDIGDTVINSISTKINFRFYFGIVNHEMREYKNTKLYNYALDILSDVKHKTALVNLVPSYINFFNQF